MFPVGILIINILHDFVVVENVMSLKVSAKCLFFISGFLYSAAAPTSLTGGRRLKLFIFKK